MPNERILVIVWEAHRNRWVIAEQHTDESDARAQRDHYRRELGPDTARLVHTADGA